MSFNEGVLRLDWRTQYACPTSQGDTPPEDTTPTPQKRHWGFLTWLIIMYLTFPLNCFSNELMESVFLIIAAYVIYSAFLNYSRYGAGSGWDLLPHSDTLRDLPYLVRDFTNHVISTLKGSSSRGGYSAV